MPLFGVTPYFRRLNWARFYRRRASRSSFLITFWPFVRMYKPIFAMSNSLRECECSIQRRFRRVPKRDNALASHESTSLRNPATREAVFEGSDLVVRHHAKKTIGAAFPFRQRERAMR